MNSRVKRFFSYYRPYKALFAADLGCAVATSAIALLYPQGVRYITKDILEGDLTRAVPSILAVGGVMMVLMLIQALTRYVYDYRGHAMGGMMERDMRAELFDHLERLPFGFYDDHTTGTLMSRFTNDLLTLAEFYHHGPENLFLYGVKFLGALVILLFTNLPLALVVLAFIPPLAVFAVVASKRLSKVYKRNHEQIGTVNDQVEQSLSGIRVTQSFTNEDEERRKFAKENEEFLASRKSIYFSESMIWNVIESTMLVITIAVAVVGGMFILKNSMSLPDLLTFLLYVGYLTEPIPSLGFIISQYQDGVAGFNRFCDVMDVPPAITDRPDARELVSAKGDVEFREVAFRYREEHEYVLKGLNLKVPAGQYVAVVGISGVGKTTLCSMIPRFYEASEGQVLVDGVDVRDWTIKSLRRNVGLVEQDVYLFAGSIMDNIRYGLPGADDAAVYEAAKAAGAHEFITGMPKGYETDIGQRGVKLSGGQKQRLSIARAFLKNPPILILDEATSSLDNASERIVQQSLERLSRNRTTFVIAHRLSTVRSAQRIIVLSDEGIEEMGTHEELIRQGGVYARMVEESLAV